MKDLTVSLHRVKMLSLMTLILKICMIRTSKTIFEVYVIRGERSRIVNLSNITFDDE